MSAIQSFCKTGAAAAVAISIATGFAAPVTAQAGSSDPSREQSNVAVLGVDQLEAPTQRATFSMLE